MCSTPSELVTADSPPQSKSVSAAKGHLNLLLTKFRSSGNFGKKATPLSIKTIRKLLAILAPEKAQ